MIKKLLFVTLTLVSVCVYAGTPLLSNFKIEDSKTNSANKYRVYFDSSENLSGTVTTTGFVISGKTITDLTINPNSTTGHYFTVSSAFTFWSNHTIRYEGGNGTVNDFTLTYIKNNISEPEAAINTYYVSETGNDKNDGESEAKAWRTLSKATNTAKAGSTVWIKAGNYIDGKIGVEYEGEIDNPIKFKGYKDTTGDLDGVMYWNYGDKLNSDEMPLINGNNPSSLDGITFSNKQYIIFENIQLTGFLRPVYFKSSNIIFRNIIAEGGNSPTNKYIGASIHAYSNAAPDATSTENNRFIGCRFLNGGLGNLVVSGNFNLIDNCKSYSDILSGTGSTDYYYLLHGSNNIVLNSLAHRVGATSHHGHGFSIKDELYPSEYNLINNCEALNIAQAYEVRWALTKYNVFKNSRSIGTGYTNSSNNGGGLTIWNGATFNTFENMFVQNVQVGIWYIGVREGGNAVNMGNNNIFKNCVFDKVYHMIEISNNLGKDMPLENNKYLNCTFRETNINGAFLKINMNNTISFRNNQFINSTFSEISRRVPITKSYDWNTSTDFVFDTNNFYKTWGSEGTNYLTVNPLFEDASNGNFRLKPDSSLIDAGNNLKEISADFDGIARPQGEGIDIGAFEKKNDNPNNITASAGADTSICSGSSATLTASGGTTYLWSTGETTASISVSPTTTTTYTVTVTEGTESDSDDVIVTIDEAPSVTLETDKDICLGETVTLTATGVGSFLWSTGATTSSISVNPSTTTTYSVTATNSCSATSISDEIVITVNDVPNIEAGSDVTIEEGSSITLTATGEGDFLWSTGETTQSISVSPSSTVTYTVTATSNTGCTNEDTVIVTVQEAASNDDNDNNNDVTVTANAGEDVEMCIDSPGVILRASGGDSYLWNTGETTASISVNPLVTTTYTVTVSNSSSIDSDSVTVFVDAECSETGGRNITNREMNLYPNPTSGGLLNIELTGFNNSLNIMIYSLNGNRIYSENIDDYSADKVLKHQIDVSRFAKGVYFVQLNNNGESETKKVLIN